MLTEILAARWLGHGRAVECYLASAAGLIGIMLLTVPSATLVSIATADLAAEGYGRLLAIPLLVKAALTGSGLILNIFGGPYSRPIRFSGALLGSLIWLWLLFKFLSLQTLPVIAPFLVMSALFSIRIMGMAWAGLPRSGAPARL